MLSHTDVYFHWNGMDGTWFHWNTKEATKGCWSILMIDLSHVILTGWKAQEWWVLSSLANKRMLMSAKQDASKAWGCFWLGRANRYVLIMGVHTRSIPKVWDVILFILTSSQPTGYSWYGVSNWDSNITVSDSSLSIAKGTSNTWFTQRVVSHIYTKWLGLEI